MHRLRPNDLADDLVADDDGPKKVVPRLDRAERQRGAESIARG